MILVLVLVTWQFFVFAKQAQATNAATWMLRIPAAPFWWAVTAMLGVSTLLQASVTVKYVRGDFPDEGSEIKG
jgi:hypothetical protein